MTLSGWTYRKSHIITHAGITDYQTKIRVYRTTGTDSGDTVYVGDKCRADFGDIRFTNSAGTELDYWMETNAGSYADFWVEIDSIETSTTIYVYYGNSSATTTSNGDATFPFFDDFTGTSLNTSKWDIVDTNGTRVVNNGLLTFTNTTAGTYSRIISKTDTDSPTTITGIKCSATTLSTTDSAHRFLIRSNGGNGFGIQLRNTSGYGRFALSEGVAWGSKLDAITLGTTYIIEQRHANTNYLYYRFAQTGAWSSWAQTIPSGTHILLGCYSAGAAVVNFDVIYQRQYAATEPTHSTWGAEQEITEEPPIPENQSTLQIDVVPTDGVAPLTVEITGTVTEDPLSNFSMLYGDGQVYTPEETSQGSFTDSHTYTEPGIYYLYAEGLDDTTLLTSYHTITVNAPTVTATFTHSFVNVYTVQFTNTSQNADQYKWDFGDGTQSFDVSPTHTYTTPGNYTVYLYTSNDYTTATSTGASIAIGDLPINATLSVEAPNGYAIPAQITIKCTVTPNPVVNTTITDIVWKIDGSTITEVGKQTAFTHVFDDIGTYVVSCELTDSRSFTRTLTQSITVGRKAIAKFTPVVNNFITDNPNVTITFTNQTETFGQPTNYTWYVNWGSTQYFTTNMTHTFSGYGTYMVALFADNAFGFGAFGIAECVKIHPEGRVFIEYVKPQDLEVTPFSCQVYSESASFATADFIPAQVMSENFVVSDRDVPIEPGFDEHGVYVFFKVIDEIGHRIVSTLTDIGSHIIKGPKLEDHSQFQGFDVQVFEERVTLQDILTIEEE